MKPTHRRLGRLGAWFGIIALLVQLLVSALPMPASAAMWGPGHDLNRICSTHHADKLPDRSPQAPHGHAQCPICVAAHLGTTTLPPPPRAFIGRVRTAAIQIAISSFDGVIASGISYSHQPRGPPNTF
jgi:Protein of unknown function (DUF2946)